MGIRYLSDINMDRNSNLNPYLQHRKGMICVKPMEGAYF